MVQGLISVVDLDEPSTIHGRANAIQSSYGDVSTSMSTTAQTWSPINSQYIAPESAQVASAMSTPSRRANELSTAGESAGEALRNYADRLTELRSRRQTLQADSDEFIAQTDAEDADTSEREEQIQNLQQRCHSLAADKDAAQNECAQSLVGRRTKSGSVEFVPRNVQRRTATEQGAVRIFAEISGRSFSD